MKKYECYPDQFRVDKLKLALKKYFKNVMHMIKQPGSRAPY